MGFWSRLFHTKSNDVVSEDWEKLVSVRDVTDFHNDEQRRTYITNCLDQISEASRDMDELEAEYARVTSYLVDIEEIERLPVAEAEEVVRLARKINSLEAEIKKLKARKDGLTESQFYKLKAQESEIAEGITKLKAAEEYDELVRKDLQRLSAERHAYEYRKAELETIRQNYKGMTIIFLSALLVCIALLLVLQFAMGMEVMLGYAVAVVAAAVSMTVLYVKFQDAGREEDTVFNTINRLIQLQNKVKIRYVNNTNLLTYLRLKYDTESSQKLEAIWKKYQKEKEERKQFVEAEARIEFYQNQLVDKLRCFRVKDPSRWLNASNALIDKREMVEIRHGLITRRQTLRQQMDDNNALVDQINTEIKGIVSEHPQYTQEILDMVGVYEDAMKKPKNMA